MNDTDAAKRIARLHESYIRYDWWDCTVMHHDNAIHYHLASWFSESPTELMTYHRKKRHDMKVTHDHR